jgi:hypothetical protein
VSGGVPTPRDDLDDVLRFEAVRQQIEPSQRIEERANRIDFAGGLIALCECDGRRTAIAMGGSS